jgi:sugar (pentulose or hexulose) kinase
VHFLAIDLGSSFIKGAVLDLEKGTLQSILRIPFPAPLAHLPHGRVEYDPDLIVAEVRRLLRTLMDSGPPSSGLVMCSQMACLVLTNAQGEPQSNCIGWRDQRAHEPHPSRRESYYTVLEERLTPQQRRELGNALSPESPAAFLFHAAELSLIQSGLVPLSLADFVLCALTGCAPSVECTNAMAYNLLDIGSHRWHQDVIDALHLTALRWPTIRRQGEVVGYLDGPSPIPCFTPIGDFQCALAGAFLSKHELSLNISTGSQVSRLTSTLEPGDYETLPFFDGAYANRYSHLPAGRSLNVLIRLLSELAIAEGHSLEKSWQYIDTVARATDTDLEVNLGFYPGPAGSDGFIRNIRESDLSVGSLFHAAFQNMAQTYKRMALQLWPQADWQRIVLTGGLAQKSVALQEAILHEFGAAHRFSPSADDTLLGLLLLARVFTGMSKTVEQATQHIQSINAPSQPFSA